MEPQNSPNATANLPNVPKYVFKFFDPGNNEIQSDNPSLPTFRLETVRRFTGYPKHTTLVCTMSGDAESAIQGEIDWKEKKITVAGVTKAFSEVQHKTGGFLNLDFEWTWTSGRYTTTYKSKTWTAKRGGEVLAVYTAYKRKTFSKDEQATLEFFVDVPNEEKVFLIFALMFGVLKAPPRKEPPSAKDAAGDAAANATANVITTVATSCCVIQ